MTIGVYHGMGPAELIVVIAIGLMMLGGFAAAIFITFTLLKNTAPARAGHPGALVPCPDCGRQISRSAVACPQCGCPRPNS